ncbi:hypothetical protein [Desulfonatronospira sp.]|uniref:hypothetical protein n=1 Tax=Desulfonatronospira sp. TaxID=1962951 RepID=UPI0025C2F59E|nr:hypothetical protein [Desulfonatronospira sp.]
MGELTSLPGYNCFHYRFGHCAYQEHLNPGYHGDWQCLVLASLEKSYDGLIHRGDAFGLSFEQLEAIWEKRFRKVDSWADLCSTYLPSDPEDDRCKCLYGNACVLLMPECHGVCSVFNPRMQKKY